MDHDPRRSPNSFFRTAVSSTMLDMIPSIAEIDTKERSERMQDDLAHKIYTVDDVYAAYNMGMEWAITVLEEAEKLTPEGRRYLIEELRRDIAGSREKLSPYILRLTT